MRWLNNKLFLITALSLWYTASSCQKLKYDIFLLGDKIGETTIELKDSGGLRHYILHSLSDAKVLFVEKKSKMSTDAIYDEAGKMLSSFFENIKNDEKFVTQALWEDNKFVVNKDGEKSVMPESINFSSLLLYFTEPKDHQKVFSERLGKFFEVIKQADGTYLATLDGHSAVYTYTAGKLTALELKASIGSIVMKLVQ